ncbi:hypothetical protein [uncultured Roseobacter sp.]|uniref:hypothetical protein n=1 Tax=uncultured Roseobacter sp. TaxID=114847 RepID=UPI0026062A1D|nr:hypothetical protein [uncultured Roseobacter sp.]
MTQNSKTFSRDKGGQATRQPALVGYCVEQIGDGPRAAWTRVAAGWAHRDGQGFDIRMTALPVNGRLTLRFATEVEDLADEAPVNGMHADDAVLE